MDKDFFVAYEALQSIVAIRSDIASHEHDAEWECREIEKVVALLHSILNGHNAVVLTGGFSLGLTEEHQRLELEYTIGFEFKLSEAVG